MNNNYKLPLEHDDGEKIKKCLKEALQTLLDHVDDIVDQYDLLAELNIDVSVRPEDCWIPEIDVTSTFYAKKTFSLDKEES